MLVCSGCFAPLLGSDSTAILVSPCQNHLCPFFVKLPEFEQSITDIDTDRLIDPALLPDNERNSFSDSVYPDMDFSQTSSCATNTASMSSSFPVPGFDFSQAFASAENTASISSPPPAPEFDFSQLFASATNIASTSSPAPIPEYVSPQLLTLDTNIAPMCQVSGHASHVSSEQRPFAKRNVSRGVHIKRPANCFMLYRSDRLKMIRHAHLKPSNAMGQCSQMIAQLWKDESASVRQQYVKRARALANLHAKTFPNYKYSPRKK